MKKHHLLTLSLLALTATAVQAQEVEIMNIELVGTAEVTTYFLDDTPTLTFDATSRQMTVTTSAGNSETLSIDDVNKITFAVSETDSESTSKDDIQAPTVLIYGTDAVHVSCSEGIKSLSIVSISGTQVFSQHYDAQPTEVVASGILSKGLYVVSVESQGKRISQKVRIK